MADALSMLVPVATAIAGAGAAWATLRGRVAALEKHRDELKEQLDKEREESKRRFEKLENKVEEHTETLHEMAIANARSDERRATRSDIEELKERLGGQDVVLAKIDQTLQRKVSIGSLPAATTQPPDPPIGPIGPMRPRAPSRPGR